MRMCRLALLLGQAAACAAAQAVPVVPSPDAYFGHELVLPGTNWRDRPHLRGEVIAEELQEFSYRYFPPPVGSYPVWGSLHSRVIRSDQDGTLDFLWRVEINSGEGCCFGDWPGAPFDDGAAMSMSLTSVYDPRLTYDADWLNDAPGGMPIDSIHVISEAAVIPSRQAGDIYVYIRPYVNKGWTAYFFLDTNATRYARTGEVFFEGEVPRGHAQLPTFAPVVPEPATWALMAFGLGALTLRHRRQARGALRFAETPPPAPPPPRPSAPAGGPARRSASARPAATRPAA